MGVSEGERDTESQRECGLREHSCAGCYPISPYPISPSHMKGRQRERGEEGTEGGGRKRGEGSDGGDTDRHT